MCLHQSTLALFSKLQFLYCTDKKKFERVKLLNAASKVLLIEQFICELKLKRGGNGIFFFSE